ncbi:Ribonuclease T [Psychrobacter phenylpyruvicus]|uniref:Ribonuclease T n=2 Tax=Psychrobacter phenylpyruvicus TaxID=29432 RepID=A0A379LIT8_9GAMM|nr:Ribonuclease T [Psychrobacter phenylpyruvicus]
MTQSNITDEDYLNDSSSEPRVCSNTSSNESSSDVTNVEQSSNAAQNGNGFAQQPVLKMADRFRKFLPVVVDVETAGFDAKTDALLELACIPIIMDDQGKFIPGEPLNAHLNPFEGANLEQRALDFTGIDPNNPLRKAIAEEEKPALRRIFKELKAVRKDNDCMKCILVGHNAHFDLSFLNAAIERTNSKNHNPFHQFSVLDTVTLSALAFGQTVLARACKAAGIEFSGTEAHSALYDTQKTAELFCHILNSYPMLTNALLEDNITSEKSGVE